MYHGGVPEGAFSQLDAGRVCPSLYGTHLYPSLLPTRVALHLRALMPVLIVSVHTGNVE